MDTINLNYTIDGIDQFESNLKKSLTSRKDYLRMSPQQRSEVLTNIDSLMEQAVKSDGVHNIVDQLKVLGQLGKPIDQQYILLIGKVQSSLTRPQKMLKKNKDTWIEWIRDNPKTMFEKMMTVEIEAYQKMTPELLAQFKRTQVANEIKFFKLVSVMMLYNERARTTIIGHPIQYKLAAWQYGTGGLKDIFVRTTDIIEVLSRTNISGEFHTGSVSQNYYKDLLKPDIAGTESLKNLGVDVEKLIEEGLKVKQDLYHARAWLTEWLLQAHTQGTLDKWGNILQEAKPDNINAIQFGDFAAWRDNMIQEFQVKNITGGAGLLRSSTVNNFYAIYHFCLAIPAEKNTLIQGLIKLFTVTNKQGSLNEIEQEININLQQAIQKAVENI